MKAAQNTGSLRVELTNRLRVIDRLYPRRNKSRSDFRSDTRGGEGEASQTLIEIN